MDERRREVSLSFPFFIFNLASTFNVCVVSNYFYSFRFLSLLDLLDFDAVLFTKLSVTTKHSTWIVERGTRARSTEFVAVALIFDT